LKIWPLDRIRLGDDLRSSAVAHSEDVIGGEPGGKGREGEGLRHGC